DIEDAFSSNFPDYTPTSPDYFPVSPGNISPDPSDNLSKYLLASLAILPSHNDPFMQEYNAAANEPPIPPQDPIDPPPVLPPSPVLPLSPMFNSRYFFPLEEIPPPKDTETPVKSPIPISSSSSVGFSSLVRSTTPPPYYPFDESIFVELDNSLWIIPRPLRSELVPEKSNARGGSMSPDTFLPFILLLVVIIVMVVVAVVVVVAGGVPSIIKLLFVIIVDLTGDEDPTNEDRDIGKRMAPKRTSTSATSTITQAAIRKLVTDSIAATLEEVANIAQRLMDQVLHHGSVQGTNDHNRKFDDKRNATNNNNNYRNSNRNNNYHQQQNRRQESVRTHAATSSKNKKYIENKRYIGNLPWCTRCTLHHTRICNVKCQTCNKVSHRTRNYRNKGPSDY
ncbi:hypothetical protein Tco_1374794, partial [Tanacetum coccineum]